MEEQPHSLNVRAPGSDLRIQFTTEARHQAFLARCVDGNVLEAYGDPRRRLSKHKKLDLIRLAEAYPALKPLYPRELVEQIEQG